ncbi:hypothetical protein WA026_010773 [Henosepilachna vigintioctopunctata]|uniref:Carboxylic ester hydrolase n=1 Tax=Henosepilachna vigintioctopunctata TaxID=420089 RepID=A0AAW1UR31_9CUCU
MLTLFILLFLFGASTSEENPVVETAYGKVRGTTLKSYSDNDFYAFLGVPFAEPPVGELRFQPPQPPKPWEGILNTNYSNRKCIQGVTHLLPGESEDCLYLNIYTPQLPNEKQDVSLPVLIYIHGGAFVMETGDIDYYKPYKIVDYDVIMVSVEYRLGFFGFVSTGDLECPGNNGFKDQQFGIRWVKENIKNFGGDPSKITISGESAGAASVGYQLIGSNAEGLFRGAIQASGSSLGTWSLQRDPRGHAYRVANYIEPNINQMTTTTKELIEWFRTVDVMEIKKACADIFGEDNFESFLKTFRGFVFSGVIEPEHEGAFLTETAYKKFESGDFNVVPTLMGITSEEALFFIGNDNWDAFGQELKEYDANPDLLVTPDMHIIDREVKRKVGEEIRRFYVGDGLLQDHLGPSVRMMSDAGFGRPGIKQAQLEAKYTDVYFYLFSYDGKLGRNGRNKKYIPGAESVGHADDLEYVFASRKKDLIGYSDKDLLTIDRYSLLWTNFVKYLNPTPEPSDVLQNVIWPKVSSNSFPYLVINETLEVRYELKKSMVDEYARIYNSYAVPPLDTY